MSMLTLIIFIIVAGIALYCALRWLPMEPPTKKILKIVVVLIIVIVALQAFGACEYIHQLNRPVPKIH